MKRIGQFDSRPCGFNLHTFWANLKLCGCGFPANSSLIESRDMPYARLLAALLHLRRGYIHKSLVCNLAQTHWSSLVVKEKHHVGMCSMDAGSKI